MKTEAMEERLRKYRQAVYESMERRADALLDLMDALSSNEKAKSVVELSLSNLYRREYSSITDSLSEMLKGESDSEVLEELAQRQAESSRIIASVIPEVSIGGHRLIGQDATPVPRPYAKTLKDRTYVYEPSVIWWNTPVTIGHAYLTTAVLPERKLHSTPWLVPIRISRVSSQQTEQELAVEELNTLLTDKSLPFGKELVVNVVDSKFSCPAYLAKVAQHENLVVITRLRGCRVLNRLAPPPVEGSKKAGHPTWYGDRFALEDPPTWGTPDEQVWLGYTSCRNRLFTVEIQAWHNLLMRGKENLPMHNHPFTLVRIRLLNEAGNPAFKNDLWLIVVGKQRHTLTLPQIYFDYNQRFDLEHFFRFGKQRFLLDAFQTPDIHHEQAWLQLFLLAYVQLYLLAPLVHPFCRPWERYLPKPDYSPPTPIPSATQTQRAAEPIICHLGTPALPPKPRGISPGRSKNDIQTRRSKLSIVKKHTKQAKPSVPT